MDADKINDITVRTADVIAAEIVAIKEQTQKILLVSAVEIGRRLAEAKEKIPYGEFVAWLEDAVAYSESTAYNLMRIAEEYGPLSSGPSGARAQTASFAKLGYTQALVLLGLPAEERAEFIARFDPENMAVREMQQAVKDRNKALAENKALQEECDAQKGTISKLTSDLGNVKKDADGKLQAVWAAQEKVTVAQRELAALKDESAAARRIAEIERESKIVKINLSTAQADARFELISKGFDDLLIAIKEIAAADPNAFRLYLNQTNQFITKTSGRLKRLEKAALAAAKAAETAEVSAEPEDPALPEKLL